MAGPLALVPAVVTFAKTQAAKFLAKRAAQRVGPKMVKSKKLQIVNKLAWGDKAQTLKQSAVQHGAIVNKLTKKAFKSKKLQQEFLRKIDKKGISKQDRKLGLWK